MVSKLVQSSVAEKGLLLGIYGFDLLTNGGPLLLGPTSECAASWTDNIAADNVTFDPDRTVISARSTKRATNAISVSSTVI